MLAMFEYCDLDAKTKALYARITILQQDLKLVYEEKQKKVIFRCCLD